MVKISTLSIFLLCILQILNFTETNTIETEKVVSTIKPIKIKTLDSFGLLQDNLNLLKSIIIKIQL